MGKEQLSSGAPGQQPPPPIKANDFIEQQLDRRLGEVEQSFDADAIVFYGPIYFGVDDILRKAVETKHSKPPDREKAVIMLTTGGGYIETVHRMVDTLRTYYQTVEFVVPNYAYSAGTIFL